MLQSQNIERIEVTGRIVVNSNDVEGVTVYNKSSNNGTVTDAEGNFKIAVALNDHIEFAALQFQDFKLTVTKDILVTKKMTVFLYEAVNKLNEVVILPYNLSGFLNKDIADVKTVNPDLPNIMLGIDDISAYEFRPDYHSKVENYAMREGEYYNSINITGIISEYIVPLFKSKKSVSETNKNPVDQPQTILDIYSRKFISDNFNIPETRINDFITFLEQQKADTKWLNPENEMNRLEYLTTQSQLFLKRHDQD